MQRARAISSRTESASKIACSGQIFVGIFFDGTGNNEQLDYLAVRSEPTRQKHSNVVRLFHAYPDGMVRGTAKHYRFYVPGVGTPFPQIDDDGGSLGTGTSWNGEPRLIWGLTRIFNAVSEFVARTQLIPDDQAGRIAQSVGGIGSLAFHRNRVFGTVWSERLKTLIQGRKKSDLFPEQINLSVFGFSRGAAEARAFVNWLYAICEIEDGVHRFAGIPLRLQFVGIFDTVASVGIANGYSSGVLGMEGHQSWASDNMQIHPGVESCLHIVAAHEVRATFPLDSVRIDGIYPPNVKEYVYPGAHSDVGGGYSSTAQGKTDALARVAGFEMYCAALAAGVPFLTFPELDERVKGALVPSEDAVSAFKDYMSRSNVSPGPVEEMMRNHMSHYFSYRYQARRKPNCHPAALEYYSRNFFKRAPTEKEFLRDTQQYFTAIIAAVVLSMKHWMKGGESFDRYFGQPFQNVSPDSRLALMYPMSSIVKDRILALTDSVDSGSNDQIAQGIGERLKEWKKWLTDNNYPYLHDEDSPERDVLSVIETISDVPQPPAVYNFFDNWVHDSMAGLAKDKVNEFLINGIGLFKFRRVYFGNRGDAILRERVAENNKRLQESAAQKRKQKRQWDLEAAEFRRTQQ